jgi:hypothetical protein
MQHRLVGIAAVALALGGCGAARVGDTTPRPDATWVRVYTNDGRGGDQAGESVRWRFASAGIAEQTGVVTPIAEGTCVAVGSPWSVVVTDDNGPGARAADGQFSDASPLNLAISRDDSGRLSVTEGQPPWWTDKPLRCGPSN